MRRSVTYGLYGVVIAGLVGGTITWATVDKSVHLTVDGQTSTIHTLSGTVQGALADAGYRTGDHDIVAPSLGSSVHDNSDVVLRRGRLLKLTVDGQQREVWVNSSTVSEALGDLGYSTGSFSSVSRSKRLPLGATSIDLRTPKHVTLVHDGQTAQLMTTAASVQEVLADASVEVAPTDLLSQSKFLHPADGMTITVQRVKTGQVVEAAPIPFTTQDQPDATITKGQTVVVTPGANGTQNVTYAVVYVDGVVTGKTPVTSAVVTAPTTQVQKVGTKAAPVASSSSSSGGGTAASAAASSGGGGGSVAVPAGDAQQIAHDMVLSRGWSEDDFGCLVKLWNRESGWRTNAANSSGAYGIPQALPGSKMASAGPDWQNNATTQITWGLGYISGRYGTPCGAWSHSQSSGWY